MKTLFACLLLSTASCALFQPPVVHSIAKVEQVPQGRLVCTPNARGAAWYTGQALEVCAADDKGVFMWQPVVIQDSTTPAPEAPKAEAPKVEEPKPEPKKKK